MRPYILAILGILCYSRTYSQTVVYVTPLGAGTKDGSSWSNAYDNQAFCLNSRTATDVQYWMAAGTYYPLYDISGSNTPADPRSVAFSVTGSNVEIDGGFAGTETALSQRVPVLHPTILSADIGTAGVNADNAYHVFLLAGRTGAFTIDGCVITAANSNGSQQFGAGIYDYSGQNITLTGCTITGNNATNGGGGALFQSGGLVTLTNDVISNNTCYNGSTVGSGGGVQIEGSETLIATQCLFYNNFAGGTADDAGGGLMAYNDGTKQTQATLIQCTFYNNRTGSMIKPTGSDLSTSTGALITLENSLFWGAETAVIYTTGSTLNSNNSIVKGVVNSPSWVTDNILFVDPTNPIGADNKWGTSDDGLQLKQCSPAINTGSNGYVTASSDLAAQTRIYNTTVDVGAYEYQSVNPVVTPSISITASTAIACENATVQFTATTSGVGTTPAYSWMVNGSSAGTDASTFSNSSADPYTVTCMVTSTDACDYGATATATPIDMSVVPVPAISIAASGGACAGSPISFNATIAGGGSDPSYQWSVGGSTISGADASTFTSSTLQNGDIVSCTLTPGSGACSTTTVTSNTASAVVYTLPTVSISPADTAVTYGSLVLLRTTLSADAIAWQWTPAEPASTSPDLAIVAQNKQQNYTLTVQTANSCSATAKATITVYTPLKMPSAFSPNGDGNNDVFRIPSNAQLTLEEFAVFDRWGNKVFSTKSPALGWNGTVNSHPAPPDTYVYMVVGTSPDGPISIKGTVQLIR